MRKYSILLSILTLIFGFTFYGEQFSITILETNYVIAAEVVFFSIWTVLMVILQIIKLKKFLSRNEA